MSAWGPRSWGGETQIAAGVAALVKAKFPNLTPHEVVGQLTETGILWDCAHPTRGEIKTSRIDAYCAVTNNVACGVNANACMR